MSEQSTVSGRHSIMRWSPLILVAGLLGAYWMSNHAAMGLNSANDAPHRLVVVWSSGDPDVAHRVAFMYTQGAARQQWFNEIELIVWGPSARLLAADKDLQAAVKQMKESGITVRACIVCADSYGVTEQLRSQGLTVKPMGKPLTELLKDPDTRVLTF